MELVMGLIHVTFGISDTVLMMMGEAGVSYSSRNASEKIHIRG